MASDRTVQEKIAGYLESKLPRARNLALSEFVHTAGGWSHEIYIFYANWNDDGRAMRQGFCLRKDPGSGLLRELSSLSEQFRVIKALEATPAPTPKAYWYEEDPSLLDGPFFVMEKVEGEVPNPWARAGKQFYSEAAKRGKLPVRKRLALTFTLSHSFDAGDCITARAPASLIRVKKKALQAIEPVVGESPWFRH